MMSLSIPIFLGAERKEKSIIPHYVFGSSNSSREYIYSYQRISPIVLKLKRVFDVFLALFILILTMPLCILVMIAIKLDSRGDVFYFQERVGLIDESGVHIIKLCKFRTMQNNAEASTGPVWAMKNDKRITRVGWFLRKTRIDEIPQIINVLRGDMSMIGSRPERPQFYAELEKHITGYRMRTYGVRPGITGWAQCNQGYDTCLDDVKKKFAYDMDYIRSLSSFNTWIKMELKIIFKTVFMILKMGGH